MWFFKFCVSLLKMYKIDIRTSTKFIASQKLPTRHHKALFSVIPWIKHWIKRVGEDILLILLRQSC